MNSSNPENLASIVKASTIFTPAAPIRNKELFSGRKDQLLRVIDAINQPGQHCIIYGERGVGKTSLGYVLESFINIPETQVFPIRVSCDHTDTYTSIWSKVFSELNDKGFIKVNQQSSRQEPLFGSFELGDDEEISPDLVRKRLTSIGHTQTFYIIIDEFDRPYDSGAKESFADTIKNLSDYLSPITIILIGVGDTVNDLIGSHRSIERAVVQVNMPRMGSEEIEAILQNGFKQLGLDCEEKAINYISYISRGFPHYAHLLGLYSSRKCLEENEKIIKEKHVIESLKIALDNCQQSIFDEYFKASTSTQRSLYPQVLIACAITETDRHGYFTQKDVAESLTTLLGKKYEVPGIAKNISELCSEARGSVLEKRGRPKNYKYRFKNSMLQPYIIMDGLKNGLLPPSSLS